MRYAFVDEAEVYSALTPGIDSVGELRVMRSLLLSWRPVSLRRLRVTLWVLGRYNSPNPTTEPAFVAHTPSPTGRHLVIGDPAARGRPTRTRADRRRRWCGRRPAPLRHPFQVIT